MSRPRKQTKYWTTKSGDKIRICDMTDSHLLNTIKLLLRIAGKNLREETSAGWGVLASLQGEMAQMFCEQNIDRIEETTAYEFCSDNHIIFDLLITDAERRKLDLEFLVAINVAT